MRIPAAVLCLLLAVGCTSGGGPKAQPSPSAVARTPAASASASPAPVVVAVLPKTFGGGFTSPSGNIVCDMSSGSVTCSVREQPWKPMPVEDGCVPGEWETVVSLQSTSTASLQGQCARPRGGAPLAYGRGVQVGSMRCGMTTKGLECLVMGRSQGFFVSKSSYRLTPEGSTLAAAPAAPSTGTTTLPGGFWGWFSSPSGNLQCSLSASSAQCTVLEHTWRLHDQPEPCEYDDADVVVEAFVSTSRGTIYSTCRPDFEERTPVPYGRGYRVGDLTCTSSASGMSCTNGRTRHGFVVGKASYRTF